MIAFFPDPFKEQLLADVFGRYRTLLGIGTQMGINRHLFGRATMTVNLEFPTSLDHLISALPPNHLYTADELIDNHTVLPYFAPFLPPARLEQIRTLMKADSVKQISPKIGIPAFTVPRPDFLRICPDCVQEDNEHQFIFFHRVHQLEGVEVCPEHKAFLIPTSAPTKARNWSCAETVVHTLPQPEYVDSDTAFGAHLIAIAKDSQWLLEHHGLSLGSDEILRRYRMILANRALGNAVGVPAQKKIREKIREFYPSKLLERLGCPIKGEGDWVHKVLGHKTTLPPLYHILILRFLGISLEQFFSQEWKLEPFGTGPWQCFNPITKLHDYAEYTINNVTETIKFDKGQQMNRIQCLFSCKCGFSYFLYGNSQRSVRAPHFRNVRSRGSEWDQELTSDWGNRDVGNYDLRIKYRLRWKDLLIEAERLKLWTPRIGKHVSHPRKPKPKPIAVPKTDTKECIAKKRKEMRSEWRKLRKDHPDYGTQQLTEIKPRIYSWLYKHDRIWLKKNKPAKVSKAPNWTKEDLKRVDAEISSKLPNAATTLKAEIGVPRRVTPAAMLKVITKYRFACSRKADLPITWKTAQQLAETDEEWDRRRQLYYSQEN